MECGSAVAFICSGSRDHQLLEPAFDLLKDDAVREAHVIGAKPFHEARFILEEGGTVKPGGGASLVRAGDVHAGRYTNQDEGELSIATGDLGNRCVDRFSQFGQSP